MRVAALAVIWGSGFLLIKISLLGFTPVQLTFARLALGALVLGLILIVMRLRLPGERRLWLHLVVAALLGNAIPYTLFGVAEQTVASNLAGAINAATPLWTVLFALVARPQDRLNGSQWAGMVLGFAGGLLILSPWRADAPPLPGLLACVVASACYGLSYVYMGRYLTSRPWCCPPVSSSSPAHSSSSLRRSKASASRPGGPMPWPRCSPSAFSAPELPTSSTTGSSATTDPCSPRP